MSINQTISLLRKVIKDQNCARMNRSTIKGFLGELIVKERLQVEGFEVEHQGNQSGYDLIVWTENNEFRIDVKTSLLKDELSCGLNHWGWALIHSNKKKPISATHFICVGLDEQLEAARFIVIPERFVRKFPKGIGQFNKVEHALCSFQRSPGIQGLTRQKREYIEKCQRWLQHEPIKRIGKNQSFHDAFQ